MGKESKVKTKYKNIYYNEKSGYYFVYLDEGRDETGKRIRTRRRADSLREARAILRDFETKKAAGRLTTVTASITLIEAVIGYTEHNKQRWGDAYYNRQLIHAKRLNAFLIDTGQEKKAARLFEPLDIEAFYNWCIRENNVILDDGTEKQYKPLSYATLKQLESFLRGLWGYMLKAPAAYGVTADITAPAVIPLQKSPFEPETLTAEQFNSLLRFALDIEVHDHAGAPLVLLCLGAGIGMRRGEIAALRWKDIKKTEQGYYIADITKQRILIKRDGQWVEIIKTPKEGKDNGRTKRERKERRSGLSFKVYDLLQIVREEQEKYRPVKEDDYIYQDPRSLLTGRDPYSKNITKRWEQFLKRYRRATGDNIPHVRLHDLRHTAATLLKAAGVDFALVSFQIGDVISGTGAAARYVHDTGDRSEIVETMDRIITTEIKRRDINNQ